MKHTVKRTTAAILAALILAGTAAAAATFAVPTIAHATEPLSATSGDCGATGQETSVKWEFDSATGTLTISGKGDMANYNDKFNPPWDPYKDKITNVVINEGVTSVGAYAFRNYPSITSIKLSSSVTIINNLAVRGCEKLEEVIFSENSQLQIIGGSAFGGCTGLTSIEIPKSVTEIRYAAFSTCSKLQTVTFADGSQVKTIADGAFYNCSNLATVIMKNVSPPTLYNNPFGAANPNLQIFVPKGSLEQYKNDFWWSDYEDYLKEGPYGYCGAEDNTGGVTSVAWNFDSTTGTLTISGKGAMATYVTKKGVPWYDYCSQITSVVVEDSVTSIGQYAFHNCTNLTSVTIPQNATSIGNFAFDNCSSLTSITIPSGVTSIGEDAFHYCRSLTTVDFAENSQLQTIGTYAFRSCRNLTSITIPASVKTLGNGTFALCKNLKEVTFAKGSQLETIGHNAFSSCEVLESIHIPAGVTSIQSYTFNGCTALATVTLSPKATMIEESAFYSCSGLKEIVIPSSVTEIGASAFQGSGLMRVTIPAAVNQIGELAFSSCDNLDEVIMEGTQPPRMGAAVFGGDLSIYERKSKFVKEQKQGIIVPYGSLSAYQHNKTWTEQVSYGSWTTDYTYITYAKEAPKPNPPAPVTTTKPTTTDENGNTITGSITRNPDGSVVDTTIVTKPNGDTTTTIVEKDPQGNTTKTTETKVEIAADGTKTETETVTEAGKAPVITKTVTKKDGSQTIEKTTSAENSRGNTVTTTETTVKDSKGNVVKKTTKKEIKNIGNGTDAVIDVDNNTAVINKIGAAKPKGMQATINNKVLSQLKEANNGKDLLLTMIVKDKDGNKRYSVEVNTADLTPKNKLYIYKKDSKTGELILVNNKAYITDSKGQLKLIIRSKGDFVLKNAEDAAKINEKILATVQAKKNKATLAKGKTEFFAFHEDLDMRNVKSISYETSDPRIATVNETGKIKGKKAGTTTITATVTLKNGETKILTMKVTVK